MTEVGRTETCKWNWGGTVLRNQNSKRTGKNTGNEKTGSSMTMICTYSLRPVSRTKRRMLGSSRQRYTNDEENLEAGDATSKDITGESFAVQRCRLPKPWER